MQLFWWIIWFYPDVKITNITVVSVLLISVSQINLSDTNWSSKQFTTEHILYMLHNELCTYM